MSQNSFLPSFAVTLALALCPLALHAAEDEIVLRISGDLIGKIESLEEGTPAAVLIGSYYARLPVAIQEQLRSHLAILQRRSEDYAVAFRAADSAELHEILDEMTEHWGAIRYTHVQEFSPEAVQVLVGAYEALFPLMGELQ